jgi:hypothetical protein
VFRRADGRRVRFEAEPTWTRPDAAHVTAVWRLGVRFLRASLAAVRRLYDLALWEITGQGHARVVTLHGALGEGTDLAPLVATAAAVEVLDLTDVRQVTAAGALRWVDFVRALPPPVTLRLRRVPWGLARLLIRVPAVNARCVIESYQRAFACAFYSVTPPEGGAVPDGPPTCRSCGRTAGARG